MEEVNSQSKKTTSSSVETYRALLASMDIERVLREKCCIAGAIYNSIQSKNYKSLNELNEKMKAILDITGSIDFEGRVIYDRVDDFVDTISVETERILGKGRKRSE